MVLEIDINLENCNLCNNFRQWDQLHCVTGRDFPVEYWPVSAQVGCDKQQ